LAYIGEQQKVLNGRGIVGRFDEGTSAGKYFYRERVTEGGKRKYKYQIIKDVSSLSEAAETASDAAIAIASCTPLVTQASQGRALLEGLQQGSPKYSRQNQEEQVKSVSIETAIKEFISHHEKRRRAELIAETTFLNKSGIIHNHLAEYLRYKNINYTSELTKTTFIEYLSFRSKTTRLCMQRECSVIGEWLKFLDTYEYIHSKLLRGGTILPRVEVRMTDRMANPAINADDWDVIINYVRNEWRKEPLNQETGYHKVHNKSYCYRTLFWHYLLLSKNTGMSPEEVLKLKWKNVDIKDVGRISQTKRRQEIEEMRAAGIDILDTDMNDIDENQISNPNAWAIKDEIGREERLISYIYTIRSKTKEPREIPCNQGKELRRWMKFLREHMEENNITWKLDANSNVFANPWNEMKPPHQRSLQQDWRAIINTLTEQGKLKGHRFSDKPYTLYSLRSTFIENHLLKGTDIFLLARISGHDVKELMKSYERLDIRARAKEITDIEYGKRQPKAESINLFR